MGTVRIKNVLGISDVKPVAEQDTDKSDALPALIDEFTLCWTIHTGHIQLPVFSLSLSWSWVIRIQVDAHLFGLQVPLF